MDAQALMGSRPAVTAAALAQMLRYISVILKHLQQLVCRVIFKRVKQRLMQSGTMQGSVLA